jgi:hypothetical protein
MMVRPKNVSYEIIPYSEGDNLDAIILSDLDNMNVKLPQKVIDEETKPSESDVVKTEESTAETTKVSKKCIKFELSLPSSSYATMALRELLLPPPVKEIVEEIKSSENGSTNDIENPPKETVDKVENKNGVANENDGSMKRSADPEENSSEVENVAKKQKMDIDNGSAETEGVTNTLTKNDEIVI